ncbi:MAG: hypothetical protein ACRD7E_26535, partial [Bryobacteraceae bacterium]
RETILKPQLDVVESADDQKTWSRAIEAPRAYLEIDNAGIAFYNTVVLCDEGLLGTFLFQSGFARLAVLRALRLAVGHWSVADLYRIWTIGARELVRMPRGEALEDLQLDLDLLHSLAGSPALADLEKAVTEAFTSWP